MSALTNSIQHCAEVLTDAIRHRDFFFFFLNWMSDYIIPLLKTIQQLPVSLRKKTFMIWVPVYPYDFSIFHSPSCSLHFQPPGFLLLLKHNKQATVSRSLNLLNSKPGMLFPKIYTELTTSVPAYFCTDLFSHRGLFFITKSLSVPLPCFIFLHIFICLSVFLH